VVQDHHHLAGDESADDHGGQRVELDLVLGEDSFFSVRMTAKQNMK